jgi:hypothetical protein
MVYYHVCTLPVTCPSAGPDRDTILLLTTLIISEKVDSSVSVVTGYWLDDSGISFVGSSLTNLPSATLVQFLT